jgi:hypothetical protein
MLTRDGSTMTRRLVPLVIGIVILAGAAVLTLGAGSSGRSGDAVPRTPASTATPEQTTTPGPQSDETGPTNAGGAGAVAAPIPEAPAPPVSSEGRSAAPSQAAPEVATPPSAPPPGFSGG